MEEDKQLIELAKKGNKEAFGKIYTKYFQKIYRYCKFNTSSEQLAQDICQESFVKAYKKLSSFTTDGQWSIQAFLFAITRNLIIDNSRKKKEANIEDFENLEGTYDIYEQFEKQDNIKKVRYALSKLNEEDRQIIILRYFEDMSSFEVAKILDINDGALRVRTHRVIQKLKDIYDRLYGKRN